MRVALAKWNQMELKLKMKKNIKTIEAEAIKEKADIICLSELFPFMGKRI